MVSSYFTYSKPKVIQALRYHFISRKEIKILMVMVNVFAILTAALFFFKKISPLAFLISSLLWIILMILFWFLLPNIIYKRASTFRDRFRAILSATDFTIENDRGSRGWEWETFSGWMESPHFFHLYFNTTSFFIVPKDAFEGDDVHEARKIFTAKIKRA
jgi:uncharacterized membrane protein